MSQESSAPPPQSPIAGHESRTAHADTRVDDLRQQLRSLGYLDAGVDRFLLAPTKATWGPAALAIRSGIRVGLLAGALLGPAATVGLGTRLPGLVTAPRDAAGTRRLHGGSFLRRLRDPLNDGEPRGLDCRATGQERIHRPGAARRIDCRLVVGRRVPPVP